MIQRRQRFRCRLPCEILIGRRRRLAAEIVSLSDGGFGLETELDVAEGDALRISVCPHRGRSAALVTALVWNERKRFNARTGQMKRVLGCVVSEPPPAFQALVSELSQRQTPRAARRLFRDEVPSRRHRHVHVLHEAPPDLTLPRPKEPLPPPKPEPEETLPPFRVRAKQLGGPRSRSLRVQARSAADAEARSARELGAGWEILEVVPETRPQKNIRGTAGNR